MKIGISIDEIQEQQENEDLSIGYDHGRW